MKRANTFALLRDLVDHELVDVAGVSCGQVDDVELAADGTCVVALLVGPTVWMRRAPALVRIVLSWAGVKGRARVDVTAIDSIEEVIHLKHRASELGLGVADRKAGKWLSRFPMS